MENGTLFVVATPIGNREDLSPRARQVLSEVDLIAAEDTRHTGRLLSHFAIKTPQIALHEHNEAAGSFPRTRGAVGWAASSSIALVSDAGTPLISDPGFRLDGDAAQRAGMSRCRPIPGPSSPSSAALSVAGTAAPIAFASKASCRRKNRGAPAPASRRTHAVSRGRLVLLRICPQSRRPRLGGPRGGVWQPIVQPFVTSRIVEAARAVPAARRSATWLERRSERRAYRRKRVSLFVVVGGERDVRGRRVGNGGRARRWLAELVPPCCRDARRWISSVRVTRSDDATMCTVEILVEMKR